MPLFAQQPPPAGPPPGPQPPGPEDGGNSTTLERVAQKTEPPRLYQVLLLNDDFTPMDFVVHILEKFFSKTGMPFSRQRRITFPRVIPLKQ